MINKNLIVIILVIFLSNFLIEGSLVTSIGGKCEPLSSSSPCQGSIEYNSIYIPNNTTQLNIETFLNATFANLTLAPVSCRPKAMVFACLRNYQPCVTINTTTVPVPLPSYPCRAECDEMYSVCSLVVHIRDPTFSCSKTSSNGDDLFPISTTQYNLDPLGGPSDVLVECNSGGNVNAQIKYKCPEPLVDALNTSNDRVFYYVTESCALPCPFNVFSKSQQRALDGLAVIRALSFVGSVFLLITFGIVANDITTKNEIIIYYAFGNICYCISFFISASEDDFRCSTVPGRYKSQENDWICGLDGFFLQFGALSMLLWITMFSFDFFLTIRRVKNTLFRFQRFFIFLVLIVLSVVPAITKKYEITLASDTCWLPVENNVYHYIFFNVPAFICIILMFAFTIYSVIQVTKIYKVTPNRDILLFNVKSIIFIVLVLFVFVMFLSFKLFTDNKKYVPIIRDYILCTIGNNGDDSLCKEISLPGFGLKFLAGLCSSSFGLVGLFGYGTDRSIKQIYRDSWKIKSIFRIFGKEWSTGSLSSTSAETTNTKRRSTKLKSLSSGSTPSEDLSVTHHATSNIDSTHSTDNPEINTNANPNTNEE